MAYKAFLVAANLNTDSCFIPLPNTLNDVREIKRLLMEVPSNFRETDVQEYTGTIATNQIISSSLQDFFERATIDDVLLLFWAGHGHLHEGIGYLVPFDGQSSNVINSMIRMTDVSNWIENSNAKVVISLIDTCHSGSMVRSLDMIRGLQITGSGKVIIAACQPFQSAYDRNGHGAFTDYLIQGLSGLAANADGIVDVYTLYSFITSKLTIEFAGNQVPVLSSSTLNGNPVEIKRIINRDQQTSISSVSDEIDSSGTSFWLGTISNEYDSFTELSDRNYKLIIHNPSSTVENEIRKLNQQKNEVPFAVRNQASLVRVSNLNITTESHEDRMEIDLEKVEGLHNSLMPGLGYGGGTGGNLSDDDIAELRAKRILFGNPQLQYQNQNEVSKLLLETLITHPTNGSIKKIIPNLIVTLQNDKYTPTRIRVIAVGYLILTGTAEFIEKLAFHIQEGKITKVHFVGLRKKYYSNVEPYCIELNDNL